MSPENYYVRVRRWLGIANVGTLVLLSLFVLYSGAAVQCFGRKDASMTVWTMNISLYLLTIFIVSTPFALASFLIEKHYQRTVQSLRSYLGFWLSCSFRHMLISFAVAFVMTLLVHTTGISGLMTGACLFSIILLARQAEIGAYLSALQLTPPAQETLADYPQFRSSSVMLMLAKTDELCFSGGITGLPGHETIVIPHWWLEKFSKQELWAELTRRNLIIASGGRTRGMALAVIFTSLGILISYLLTNYEFGLRVDTSAGVVTMSCCFTLWSFLGLLTMPYASRKGVIEADRLALTKSVGRELLIETIGKIDSYVEGEESRTLAVDTIFHPIPTLARRLSALDGADQPITGAWHGARYAVFLSILGLGLLGHAVHCNAGKPDLWALLPAD